MEEIQPTQKSGLNPLAIAGVVALVLIGGLFLLMNRNNSASQTTTQQRELTGTPAASGTMPHEMDSTEQGQTIIVNGDNFSFDKKEIRVKKGQKVSIMFTNGEGLQHDFVLDEFNVRTRQLQAGGVETVTFTPDKTGAFEFYCSVGKHREMGMKGNLIVE